MDIGNQKNNYTYYEGYEGEPEIVIESENTDMQILHIWDGYLDDLLREPKIDGNGWLGFTRDYHQCEGAFGDNSEAVITDIPEYLNDLKLYEDRQFDYAETKDVYNLLCSWLENAIKNRCEKISIKIA